MKKFLLLFVVALLIATMLVSCASCSDDGLDKFQDITVSTSDGGDGKAFAKTIYVVVSYDASSSIIIRAQALVKTIEELTGISTFLKYDNESASRDAYEVLVGNTSRLISQENLKTLHRDEYVCHVDRGSIVVGGRNDEATLAALDIFERDVLPGATYAGIMNANANFDYKGTYEISNFTLNGYPIYDYTLVVDQELEEIGFVVQEYIAQNSDYVLDLVYTEDFPGDKKSIRISRDTELADGVAVIEERYSDIYVTAPDTYGVSLGAAKFLEILFFDVVEGETKAEISERKEFSYQKDEIAIAFGYADNKNPTDISFNLDFIGAVASLESPVVCFGAIDAMIANDLKINCDEEHSILTVELSNGKVMPIVYRNDDVLNVSAKFASGALEITLTYSDGKEWKVRFVENAENVSLREGEILITDLFEDGGAGALAEFMCGYADDDRYYRVYAEGFENSSDPNLVENVTEDYCYNLCDFVIGETYSKDFIDLKNAID